jgi:XTP/dITP diphosphohydrolase
MKSKLVFASNNKHKLEEVRAIIGNQFEILSLNEIGCFDEIPETSPTLHGNALQKGSWIKEKYGFDCFADDTGLMIDCLDGAPGVYSARYAGENVTYDDNVNKVLNEMRDCQNRKAHFATVICLIYKGENYFFEGNVYGEILSEKKGENGFGYDPVFLPEGYTQTLAEMSSELKNSISHRYFATLKLKQFLDKTFDK